MNEREERRQEELAAREAARIGADGEYEALDPAELPVRQAGGGEAEGFELAEELLIKHATHSDDEPAHEVLHDAGEPEEQESDASLYGEADRERTSEKHPASGD